MFTYIFLSLLGFNGLVLWAYDRGFIIRKKEKATRLLFVSFAIYVICLPAVCTKVSHVILFLGTPALLLKLGYELVNKIDDHKRTSVRKRFFSATYKFNKTYPAIS